MGMRFVKRIPPPEEIIAQLPVKEEVKALRDNRVNEIRRFYEMKMTAFY